MAARQRKKRSDSDGEWATRKYHKPCQESQLILKETIEEIFSKLPAEMASFFEDMLEHPDTDKGNRKIAERFDMTLEEVKRFRKFTRDIARSIANGTYDKPPKTPGNNGW